MKVTIVESPYSTGDFDTPAFWAKCREIASSGSTVYVSELQAPPFARCVWSKARKSSVVRGDHAILSDNLYLVEG